MALTYLLRSAQIGCKLRPCLGASIKINKSTVAACQRFDFVNDKQEKCTAERRITFAQPVPKLSQIVRQFSVTPVAQSGHNDHSKLWKYEGLLSKALIGICPLSVLFPNILFDLVLAVSVVMHMHWGIEAIVVDYVRPVIFGSVIPKIALYAVYGLSIFVLVGLLHLTFLNSGIGNSIRMLWRI
ncbi:hypothetical protein O3M35_002821 [Rhynocoris fuscipes]|uniref:Succinate dehydrogenase [ubiquinone] cytochrome b small subunit n=1 Tax=Rhynocoris fuscipes TaxID=488301 RepID=A0AAW1CQ69_9HEMI